MDSPPFEFVEDGGSLTVISLPERFPVISGNKGHHYQLGDQVVLNCTCYDTYPPATIRWFINGKEVIYIATQRPATGACLPVLQWKSNFRQDLFPELAQVLVWQQLYQQQQPF